MSGDAPVTYDELDERLAKLDARIAARIDATMAKFGSIGEMVGRFANAQIEGQRMANEVALETQRMQEAGPTERLRQNLVAGCYSIRLRAACEAGETLETAGVYGRDPNEHSALARLALADAEAVLAVLAPKATP